jgi:hypothetical protein
MTVLEYDSEIENEAVKIVKTRKNKAKEKIIVEPVIVEPPVIIEPVIEPSVIIEPPTMTKTIIKRERSAKQKETTEKMRQKLKENHESKKKLAEERNIEEDILLKRIKERATKKTIAREIKKKVKQLDLETDTEDEIIEPEQQTNIINDTSSDESIIITKQKSKSKTQRKPIQTKKHLPPENIQISKPMVINFV